MNSLLFRSSIGAAMMLTIALRSSPVDAQPVSSAPAPVSECQRAEAERLTDDALEAERAKDYTKAITLYWQAYRCVPHPVLLFNIGQAHEFAGNPRPAAACYWRYLRLQPTGEHASFAREILASLLASTSSPLQSSYESAECEPKRLNPPPIPMRHIAARGEAKQQQRATEIKHAGYGLMIGSVVLSAATIGFASRDQPTLAIGMGLVAVVFLGGGVMAYDIGDRRLRAARAVAWSPVVGTGFAGVALAGTLP